MPAITKDLYLANSLKELKEKSSANLPTSQNITIIYNSLKKMIQEAHNTRLEGDEEKSFFLYFRLALIIDKLKKSAEYYKNKATYDRAVNEIWRDAINWTEQLQKSLEKRYKEIKMESPEPQRKKSEVDKSSQDGKTATKIEMPVSVTSSQLYELITDTNTSLLIIDARLPGEFEFSHIKHPSIFNIPETLLVPGVTAHSLEKWMNESVRKLWQQRGSVDFVILVDWNSYEKLLNSTLPLYCLREALCKWDSQKILRTDPLILEGGYIDFVNRYPMMTTNSNVSLPPRVSSSSSSLHNMMNDSNNVQANFNAVDVSYPILDDELEMDKEQRLRESQSKTLIDRAKKPSPATPSHSTTKVQVTPAVNRSLKPAYDGANAKDVMPYLRQDVNNNLRLVQEQLDKERQFEILRSRREKEAEEGMRIELQKQEEALMKRTAELEAEARAKEEEHQKALAVINQMKKDLEKSNQRIHELEELQNIQMMAGEKNRLQQEVARLREERKKKEKESSTISTVRKMPEIAEEINAEPAEEPHSPTIKTHASLAKRGSLSRSHSSPNIAQMIAGEEEEANHGVRVPHFDRTLKPQRTSDTAIRKLNLEPNRTFNTMRNLQPIYGIGGRAVTGLKNLGNTCYMNSIIQCLSATTPLTSYLCNRDYLRHINRNKGGEVLSEFAELIIALWAGQYKSVVPRDFKNVVSKYISVCAGHDQQDSHEFLMVFLEKMHAEVNTAKPPANSAKLLELDKYSDAIAAEKFWNHHKLQNESIFVELFEGLLRSTLTCLFCQKVSNSYEVFSCLSLPLPLAKTNKTSLKECLNFFLKTERISGEGAWNCPQCKQKQDAEKKLVILRLPKILIFHLKRFSYEGLLRQKLQTFVDFPLQDLDMSSYVYGAKMHNTYYLYGVVNHFGTLEGGHYIAHCKNSNNNKWYKFDDQEVTELGITEVRNPLAAYLLFYSSIDLANFV